MLKYVKNKIKKIARLDIDELVDNMFEDKDVQSKITYLNQQQLDEGKQADGTTTGQYSEASVKKYGKNPGPITLYDTGEFRSSMEVKVGDEEAFVTADTMKDNKGGGQTDLLIRWPEAIGLTDESKTDLKEVAKKTIIKDIREAFAS